MERKSTTQKQTHKRLLSVLLGLVLCVSLLPATVFAEIGAQTQTRGGV